MTQDTDLVARLRQQELSSEMSGEFYDAADWQGGYDAMVESGRKAADRIEALLALISEAQPYRKAMEQKVASAESELTTLRADLLEARKRLGEVGEIAKTTGASKAECLDRLSNIATIAKEPGQ